MDKPIPIFQILDKQYDGLFSHCMRRTLCLLALGLTLLGCEDSASTSQMTTLQCTAGEVAPCACDEGGDGMKVCVGRQGLLVPVPAAELKSPMQGQGCRCHGSADELIGRSAETGRPDGESNRCRDCPQSGPDRM